MAARYSLPPPEVLKFEPAYFVAAIRGSLEDQRERYRQAAFSIWLQSGKKAGSWPEFLRKLNLSGLKPKKRSRRRSEVDTDAIYEKAEAIKRKHLKRGL